MIFPMIPMDWSVPMADENRSGTPCGQPPFSMVPVGVVHSGALQRRDVRRGGSEATVEIFPAYADALDQLEHNSHVILFGWFHQADRTVMRTRPRKVAPFAHERGVFASRSPDRPNPVAMTIVPLLERRGLELLVADLDFMDGTPVVDVKPYCPGWDTVFSAVHRRRANPALQTDDILREFYRRDLVNHVGRDNGDGVESALAVEACLMATRRLGCDPRDASLKVVLHQASPLMDGLMAITGASLSNGRLAFADGALAHPAPGKSLKVEIRRGVDVLTLESSADGSGWKMG